MIYLLFYDISNDQLRQKISKRLVADGYERIQLSVFAGLNHPKHSTKLWREINDWLKGEKTAKFYVIKVSKKSFRELTVVGELDWDLDLFLGTKNSLFI